MNPNLGTISASGLYTAPASLSTQQNVIVTANSGADPTKSGSATVTLLPGVTGGAIGRQINLIAAALCRRVHTGPSVSAGLDQYGTLSCNGSQCSSTGTVTGAALSYTLPPGFSLTYGWSLVSGPAPVVFGSPTSTSTTVTATAAGVYTLQFSVDDGILTGSALTHFLVNPSNANTNGNILIAPTISGPNAVNTPVSFKMRWLNFAFGVATNAGIQVTVTGANPQSAIAITDANGIATFTYAGANPGTDTIVAVGDPGTLSGPLTSEPVTVTWIVAPPRLTTSPVTGQFFPADGSGVFNILAAQAPVFTQVFPGIDFDPAAGTVPGNTSGVTSLTRPFTAIATDRNGNYAGAIVAQGGGYQAGAGPLYNFGAVFTGTLNVPAAGQVTFTITSDDAFIFGMGNAATRVSGPQTNTPAVTPFKNYAVMGGVNQREAPAASSITVNFPAAGSYPYELDYAKGGDKNLTLTMLANGVPIPAAAMLTLTPATAPTKTAGQIQQFVLTAADADGVALSNLPVTFTVTGENQESRVLFTDGVGQIGYAYDGSPLLVGADLLQAAAHVNGTDSYSNAVVVNWNSGVNQAPVVNAGTNQTVSMPAQAVLNGAVSDDGLPSNTLAITWSMTSGPGTVVFDNPSQAVTAASFSAAGTYVLQLSATDGTLTSNSTVTVIVNPPTSWNTGWLAAPVDESTVTGQAPVTLIAGITLVSGTLTYYPANNPGTVTTISTATTGAGQIAVFDTTGLNNGGYFLILNATNSVGVTQTSQAYVTVAGDYKPGRVTATVTDFTVPSPGLAIQIQRTYDSLLRSQSSDFGYGWRLGLNAVNMTVTATADVALTIGGKRRTFYFTPSSTIIPGFFVPQYTAEPGMYGSLVTTGDNCSGVLIHIGNIYQCGISNAGSVYQATAYKYTDPYGRVYTIGSDGALQSLKDLNGNTLTLAASGITSSTGLSVPFVRDNAGRITKITDTLGNQYQYAYDANGNLATVTLPSIATPAQYQYDASHLLTTSLDPGGNPAAVTTYYSDGRLKTVSDAVGNLTQYSYDSATRTTTVTNPDGGIVIIVADAYGEPLSVTNPLGKATTYSYDATHNLLTVTDPLNKTTTFTNNSAGFRTSKNDPLNHQVTAAYNQFGGPTTVTDAVANTISVTYDAQFRPTVSTDSIGQLAKSTYDANGNVLSFTDSAGATSTMLYDAQGNVTSLTDALNRTTTYSYDALGRLRTSTSPRGGVTTYTYNELGKITQQVDAAGKTNSYTYDVKGNLATSTDALNRTTTYTYDAANRLTQTTFPDTTTASMTYDWRGNELTSTDPAGRVTKSEYDLAGRLTKVTTAYGTPDAVAVTYTYDAADRKLTESDGRGNTTTYAYDAAGNSLMVTDANNKATTFTYDAANRRISATDPNLHATQYIYDARNRVTKTTYHDGSNRQSSYDGLGRPLVDTDQAGKTTTRAYDAEGQLSGITDALNQLSNYGYDADGNWTRLTDPNNHTTTQSFDPVGRLLSRMYPTGGLSETNVYDANGQRTSTTDFGNKTTTFSYDLLGRLLSKTPDPSLGQVGISFTYTTTGRRATMTDGSGSTTYGYDNLDRLVSKATPQGTLTYTYDGSGNIASVKSSNTNGVWLNYTYDTVNRLSTVVDNRLPVGQNTTTYTYDPASNLVSVTYPNGIQSNLAYDVLNRLGTAVLTKSSTIANCGYQRGAAGHISGINESSGRALTFGYDATYRLLSETVLGDPSGRNGATSYTLDPAGNRLSRSSTISGVAPQTLTYDANDQIAGETYDPNGNVTSANGGTFVYDFLNRLTSANGGTVAMLYDGDDNRAAKTVGGVTTRYLVDDVNPTGYPQVSEEVVGSVVNRTYAYGLERISQTQWSGSTPTVSFYGYDGQRNVRLLTDSTGMVTDTYDYDSFGNVLATTGTTPNLYRFSGEQMDSDLGLYYLRARYYNPQTGRFMRRDPLPAISGDIANQHRYLYAAADPTGMDAFAVYGKTAQWIVTGLVVFTAIAIFEYQHPTIDGVDLLPNLHIPPVKINLPAWDAKCIGDRVDSIMAVAAATAGVTATVVKCSLQAKTNRPRGKCPPGWHDHHLLPFAMRALFSVIPGIDIEDPKFHRCCPPPVIDIHSEQWNNRWEQFFTDTVKPTAAQVINWLDSLMNGLFASYYSKCTPLP